MAAHSTPSRREQADALNTAAEAMWGAHEDLERAIRHLDLVGYRGFTSELNRTQRRLEEFCAAAEQDADKLTEGA